jgi:hypothetical protein
MMSMQWLSLFLALLPVSLALATAAPDANDYLKPIHWEDYQAAYTGAIERRQVIPKTYGLSEEAHLIYGRLHGKISLLLLILFLKNGNRC